jgi:hypothetical protein
MKELGQKQAKQVEQAKQEQLEQQESNFYMGFRGVFKGFLKFCYS